MSQNIHLQDLKLIGQHSNHIMIEVSQRGVINLIQERDLPKN